MIIRADAAEASALWHNGEAWQVVDTLGRVMTRARVSDHVDLPKLAGEGAPIASPNLVAALSALPSVRRELAVARRISERRWDLQLKSGAIVRLPADENLAAGVSSLAEAEASSAISRRALALIDLRVPGRIYLTPAQPPIDAKEAA